MASTVQKILDSEIPSPTWSFRPSLAAPIRSDMTFTRADVDNPDPTARTLDPRSGLYEGRGADTPRIHGSQQELLVESARRTNLVPHSSAWSSSNTVQNSASETDTKTSVIDGKTAYEYTGENSDQGARVRQSGAGTYSSGEETAYAILERGTADNIQFRLGDSSQSGNVAGIEYDWGSDTSSSDGVGAELSVHHRRFTFSGREMVRLIVRYDPTDQNGTDRSGNSRAGIVFVDTDGNNKSTIIHHVQIEEAANASSPIVTGSSATTRGADDVTIFSGGQPEWWNPNEGTFLMEMKVRSFHLSPAPVPLTLNPEDDRVFITQGAPPFGVKFRDADVASDAVVSNLVTPFESFKVALSLLPSEARLAASGTSDTISYDGNGLGASNVDLSRTSALYSFGKITYFPQAFPATEADRSAGDPVSLETLTS